MIRFNNDYNHGAHANILQALAQTNDTQYGGYGVDDWCDKAEKLILELSRCPQGKVYFSRERRRPISSPFQPPRFL